MPNERLGGPPSLRQQEPIGTEAPVAAQLSLRNRQYPGCSDCPWQLEHQQGVGAQNTPAPTSAASLRTDQKGRAGGPGAADFNLTTVQRNRTSAFQQ